MKLENANLGDKKCQAIWQHVLKNHPSRSYHGSDYDAEMGVFSTYAVDQGQRVAVEVSKVKTRKRRARKAPTKAPAKKAPAKKRSAKAAVRKAAAAKRSGRKS